MSTTLSRLLSVGAMSLLVAPASSPQPLRAANPSASTTQSAVRAEPALRRYDDFLARLRNAATLDFRADVFVTRRNGDGKTLRVESRLDVHLGRGNLGSLHRERIAVSGGDEAGGSVTEILADGDVAYQVDRSARAYVRFWPPRFLAAGDHRGILLLRAFLNERIERPTAVRYAVPDFETAVPDLVGLRADFGDYAETIFLDGEGTPRYVVRLEHGPKDALRSEFTIRECSITDDGDTSSYSRRPPADFNDIGAPFAKSEALGFEHAPALAGAPASDALVPGARDVEGAFVDAESAVVRLRAMRGRPVVVAFLDPASPTSQDAVRRIQRLATESAENGRAIQFLCVVEDAPQHVPSGFSNLRFVRPSRPEVEAVFGVKFHPTAFVLDREGTVVLRSAVALDEKAIRRALEM